MPHDAATYSSFFETCLLLALALPLVSGMVSLCISERYAWMVTAIAPLLLLISTAAATFVFASVWNGSPYQWQCTWFEIAGWKLTAGVYLNPVSAIMVFTVTLISFLVHVYSTGYMAGDDGLTRYFSMLGVFTFSMLGIVVANSLLLVFVFWELVGFSSYMLIGHWRERPAAAAAAKKAFIMNRIGDAGFLIGLMIVWTTTGTFDLLQLSGTPAQTAASLCIFCGVVGKSAQLPLMTWLPDAMEGPTPVSALIHAATMVAAGVFLLVRVDFLFTTAALDVVAIVGIATALVAAASALVQTDIKKILAYSTLSQLGLMVAGVGAGAPEAAMLHLLTHAFFKACLFLSAGAVIHVLHHAQQQSHVHFDVQHIGNLGGLRKKLPLTFLAFVVGGSALAGVPFFSGFLSKDAILSAMVHWKGDAFSWRWVVMMAAFVVSFLTVLYTFRLIWTVFMGEEKETKNLAVAEPPVVMRWPVMLLAACSLWLVVSWNPLRYDGWVFHSLAGPNQPHSWFVAVFSAGWVLLALAVAYALLRQRAAQSPLLLHGFYLDKIYKLCIVQPALQVATLSETMDRRWIDRVLHATAYAHVLLAHLTGWFDRAVVDGVVNGTASVSRMVGNFARSFQGGKIQHYIFWAVLAMIIFLIWTLF